MLEGAWLTRQQIGYVLRVPVLIVGNRIHRKATSQGGVFEPEAEGQLAESGPAMLTCHQSYSYPGLNVEYQIRHGVSGLNIKSCRSVVVFQLKKRLICTAGAVYSEPEAEAQYAGGGVS